jgi:DUF1680 family protein
VKIENQKSKIKSPLFLALGMAVFTLLPLCSTQAGDKVPPKIALQALPFDPCDVRLLEGPFQHAMELDAKYLLSLEPDRLLSWYRKEAGLTPKAEVYGGWESQGIAGHSLGHYLSACARMYQDTGDVKFRERVDMIVNELAECQKANGNGYVGALPNGKRIFAEVARGDIRSAGFDLNGGWVPWYNLHKLFAGLIDAYRYAGSARALEVVSKMGDWVGETTKGLTDAQWQKMLACEHGGMNEAMADLYALTGEARYLDLARRFYHQAILDPLAAGRDELEGKHANTQIPKIIGAERLYELTGEEKFAKIADAFWDTVTRNHSYVTGGNSLGEHFGAPGKLNDRLAPNTTETCNTYNMLKLTRALFEREPRAAYADYYERAVWNHILASQNPEDGMVCYFVSLEPAGHKVFLGEHDFTCCNGSGMENHTRYGENIYFHNDSALWVNLFIASELNWTAKGLKVRQETRFPQADTTRLTFTAQKPVQVAVNIRHPFWATAGFTVKLNGAKVDVPGTPQSYATIDRTWKSGDVLDVEMPMPLRMEAMPDNAQRVAFFSGPILLAGDLGALGEEPTVRGFVTSDRPPAAWIKAVEDEPLIWRTSGAGRPRDVQLAPFYTIYDRVYSVYWDLYTEDQWQAQRAEHEAEMQRRRELEARTTDLFRIGEMQPERDHNLQGEKTAAAEFGGRKLRHAQDGGWFSFDVAVPSDVPADLIITYWGSETGARTFDILVNNEKIATQSLNRDKPEKFWDKTYPLPDTLTKGKSKVTVKFQAHPGNYAGGVFGVRVVKRP